MKSVIGAALTAVTLLGFGGLADAGGDKDPAAAIVAKGIKALGGEDKLSEVQAYSWKGKGTIRFGDNENGFTVITTVQGLDHFRREVEGDFGGNKFQAITVLKGNKGWRKFGDMANELEGDGLANEKRNLDLQVVPVQLVPLLSKGFKFEAAGEDKVGDKAAVAIKATGPDGKDFKLYFDKASGLPVKQVAQVSGFGPGGKEFLQETTYSNYKDFDGIKRATKTEAKRDGETFMTQEITEFTILTKVDPKAFSEPQ